MRTKGYFAPLLGAVAILAVGTSMLFTMSDSSQAGLDWGTKHPSLPAPGKAASAAGMAASLANLPLRFEVNQGQAGNEAQYVARGPGYSVLLSGAEATLMLDRASQAARPARSTPQDRMREARRRSADRAIVRMEMVGANRAAAAQGLDRLATKTNYFLGSDPGKWHSNVANYAQVGYREIYPGVDLVYYGKDRRLEYDLLVAAGSNPGLIRMRYTGAESIRVDREGALVLRVKGREMRQLQPKAYQTIAGEQRPVEARYSLKGTEVQIALGNYDRSQALVIDPALVYSTYFGGNGNDSGFGIAVDGSGNVYLAGLTLSTNLPATGTLGPANKNGITEDAFVVKLDSNAHSVIYCDYLGGSNFDEALAIAVDATGAYVGGDTSSSDFPGTAGNAQAAFKGTVGTTTNGWLAKLNPAGSALLYATYLGGSGNDAVNNLTVDGAGLVYATGFTQSSGATPFPTTAGVFQTTFGGPAAPTSTGDAFVTKLNAAGTAFVYSTYLGGSGEEQGNGIVVDGSGNVFVGGDSSTLSGFPNPPSPGVIQPAPPAKSTGNIGSGWIAELNPAATALTFFTYLGGSGTDQIQGLARDTAGNLYAAGFTTSPNFPVSAGAAQGTFAGGASTGDAFVTKINATGTAISYSTYLGGSGDDAASDIKVDANFFAYVVGPTTSANFPVTAASANQATLAGAQNAFIVKLHPNGTQVVYGSYHGGNTVDGAQKMALDANNFAYFTGSTTSTNFPATPNSGPTAVVQTANGGGVDAFAVKFDASVPVGALMPTSLAFGNQRINTPSATQTVTYTNIGNATLSITSIMASAGYTQTNTCGTLPGATLAPGASCTITVTFQPTANGATPGTLTVIDNAVGSPRVVMLTGTGTSPLATLTPSATVNFGNQNVGTTSASQTVTLTNTGTDTLNITNVSVLGGTNPGDFTATNTCGATLAPNATCTFTFTFTPTNGGLRSATQTISDDSGGAATTQTITLNGTGVTPVGGTFLLNASPTTATIHPGQTATYALTVSPVGGFNRTVSLSCTGAPARANCTVIPSSVTLNGVNSAPATVQVTTTAASTLLPHSQSPRGTPPWLWALLAAMITALAAGMMTVPARARVRYLAPAALLMLIAGLTVFSSACGNSGTPGTPTGTSILVVTGTGGGQTQTLNLTLNVQ